MNGLAIAENSIGTSSGVVVVFEGTVALSPFKPILLLTVDSYRTNITTTRPSILFQGAVAIGWQFNTQRPMPAFQTTVVTHSNITCDIITRPVGVVFNVHVPNTVSLQLQAFNPIIKGQFTSNPVYQVAIRRSMVLGFTALFPSSVSKQTWAFNTITAAHTRYTNYDFDSYFKLGTDYYGVGIDGAIYKFGYDQDDYLGTNAKLIQAQIDLPKSGFSEQQMKMCADAMVFARAEGDLEVSFTVDEEQEREGFYITSDTRVGMHRKRVKIPKGMRGNVWQFKIKNVDGCDFSINQFEIFIKTMQRIY